MILWIDGTFGVGKTAVCETLAGQIEEAKYIDSDDNNIFEEMANYYGPSMFSGDVAPQSNRFFIDFFRKRILEESENNSEVLIVSMAITSEESKKDLLEYLMNEGRSILHFILSANESTILSRIEHDDSGRDKSFATKKINENIRFLQNNFINAIWIDTEGKSPYNIAKEINEVYLSESQKSDNTKGEDDLLLL